MVLQKLLKFFNFFMVIPVAEWGYQEKQLDSGSSPE